MQRPSRARTFIGFLSSPRFIPVRPSRATVLKRNADPFKFSSNSLRSGSFSARYFSSESASIMSSNQKALKIQSPGAAGLVLDAPIPTPKPNEVLVKVGAVAINPTDWKHIDWLSTPGATVGCDYAGIVEKVGADVTNFKEGDRIAGVAHGSNKVSPHDGCFAEHTVGVAVDALKLPKSWKITDGSTLGISVSTVGQGLYQSLALPLPGKATKSGTPLLIYGGSTATGVYAIQYAKLSGCKVAVTCSPHNNELVKSLGADAAFDYSHPDVAKQIREYFQDELFYVFDTITTEDSVKISTGAIGTKGGKYSALSPAPKQPRADVEYASTLAYTILGREFKLNDRVIPASPEDAEFGAMFWKLTEGLLADGKLKPITTDIREGGLERILDGISDLRAGKVSGKKIVYVVDSSIS